MSDSPATPPPDTAETPAPASPAARSWLRSDDTWAVIVGFGVVLLSLGPAFGVDLLGWAVKTSEWVDPAKAIAPASKSFAGLGGTGALLVTFAVLLGVFSAGIVFIGGSLRRFVGPFAVLFFIAFLAWAAGHYGPIASTPDKRKALGLGWSLGLTGEAGYLLALFAGLAFANFLPRTAGWFREAARSELYIKAAVVVLGAGLGLKAVESGGKTDAILFRGLAAIIEAYLIYWAVVYFIARKWFGFSREWAAPLASGISICGVSAAITTGAAIRARPVVPVMVSSLVVVFSVVEMVVLPFIAREFLADQPMVAAGWMGLAVKTDGAAISSGAITESLVYAKAAEGGVVYEKGWMVATTTTVKVFIDLFIGVWAVVLAAIWAWKIDRRPGQKLPLRDIWQRFPKFVFGYVLAFLVFMLVGMADRSVIPQLKSGTGQADVFRRLFFVLTFFSIGLHADFRKLWAEGLGKLALVYAISLFGFVVWVGLVISWVFFGGMYPPTAGGG